MRLFALHERQVRGFLFTLLPNRDAVDEVMQEVSVVLWKKFSELESDDGFLPWAFVVSKFEVLMYRRRLARDRFVFDEHLIGLLAAEHPIEDTKKPVQEILKTCLVQLSDADRTLVLSVYASGVKVVSIAERMGVSSNSLYKSLGRLRRKLQQCVEAKMRSLAT
nr:sigma-70 family RNA polymerase sigma factor [Neorhodopirellula pilleata]